MVCEVRRGRMVWDVRGGEGRVLWDVRGEESAVGCEGRGGESTVGCEVRERGSVCICALHGMRISSADKPRDWSSVLPS